MRLQNRSYSEYLIIIVIIAFCLKMRQLMVALIITRAFYRLETNAINDFVKELNHLFRKEEMIGLD